MMMTSPKGFKVTDADRKTRVGIAAKDLEELKAKTIQKFKVDLKASEIHFQLPDGTLVETNDYLDTLKSHSLLVWVKKGEVAYTDAEILYNTIRDFNHEYLSAGEKVQEFFTENMKSKVYKLAEVLKGIDEDKSKISLKGEHPEWFEGLDTSAKTKEDYMFRKAQDRIRTFFYRTREELRKHTELPQQELQFLMLQLNDRLKKSKFNGHYFDRRKWDEDDILKSMCNKNGDFYCQGRWDKDRCLYEATHQINPYRSREERIIFQCWNLDHVKERTRSIIPAIREALKQKGCIGDVENFAYFEIENYLDIKGIYNDLFTSNNLKLVHIVCHDKGVHSKKAGPYFLL